MTFRTIVQGLILAVLAVIAAQLIDHRLPPEPVVTSPAPIIQQPVIVQSVPVIVEPQIVDVIETPLYAAPTLAPELQRGGYVGEGSTGQVGGRDMSGDTHKRSPSP